MIFVKFKIDNGGIEYFDYSWFNNYSIAHYEDAKSITDKDMIEQTYAEGRSTRDFEENFDEDTNTYTDYDDDVISVHRVQEMTQKRIRCVNQVGSAVLMIVTCENCKVNKGEEEDMTYKFVPILLCDDCYTGIRYWIADELDIHVQGVDI